MNRTGWWLFAICLASTAPGVPAAEPLPRIFFSPAERAAIITQRREAPDVEDAAPAGAAPAGTTSPSAPSPPPTTVLRLDGISFATGGETFAWFSGQRYRDGSRLGSALLQITRDGVRLTSPGGKMRTMRVGETLEIAP